jgi:hypothetical protein
MTVQGSAFVFASSRFSRATSASSGLICPRPGKACLLSALASRTQRLTTFDPIPKSCATWVQEAPRSVTSFTASTLNSLLNTRLVITHLVWHHRSKLGVNETGISPALLTLAKDCLGSRLTVETGMLEQGRYAGQRPCRLGANRLLDLTQPLLMRDFSGLNRFMKFTLCLVQEFLGFRAVTGHIVVIGGSSALQLMDRFHDVIMHLLKIMPIVDRIRHGDSPCRERQTSSSNE